MSGLRSGTWINSGNRIAEIRERRSEIGKRILESRQQITEIGNRKLPYTAAMRTLSLAVLVFAAFALLGCGKSNVVGKWQGAMIADPGHENDPDVAMAKGMMGALSFDLKSDNTFSGQLFVPIEGTYTVSGNQVTLQITKVMGVENKAKDGNKPVVLTVSGDGKTMTANELSTKSKDSHFHAAFTRQS
jgi:hypothetical protein